MKILAVDDDPVTLELLSHFVAQLGNQTLVTANSAAEALKVIDAAGEGAFDCFMFDIQMPVTTGIALTKLIRQRNDYRDAPIIMLTAMAEKSYIDAAFSAGATDYVTKPFQANDLRGRFGLIEKAVAAKYEFAPRAISVAKQPIAFTDPIGLHESVSIFDVENVIEHTSMENYLLQLSRSAIFGSSTFAFAIRDIENMHRDLCPFEFHSLISDVAEVISDAMNSQQFLMSYSGSGVFVCVAERGWTPDTQQLMDRVNLFLSQTDLYNNNGEPLYIRVSVGKSIRFVWKTGQSVLDALGQAYEYAEIARATYAQNRNDFWTINQSA